MLRCSLATVSLLALGAACAGGGTTSEPSGDARVPAVGLCSGAGAAEACTVYGVDGTLILSEPLAGVPAHLPPVAVVKRGAESLVLDRTGDTVVLHPLADGGVVSEWSEGVAAWAPARNQPWRVIGADGVLRGSVTVDTIAFAHALLEPPFERSRTRRPARFSAVDGRIPACSSKGGGCGYLSTDGEWALEPRWEAVQPFAEGHACARSSGAANSHPWELIGRDGVAVLEGLDGCHGPPSEGLVWVQRKATKFGDDGAAIGAFVLVKTDGTVQLERPDLTSAGPPIGGLMTVVSASGTERLRADGSVLELPSEVGRVWDASEGRLAFLSADKKHCGWLDVNGKVAIPATFPAPSAKQHGALHFREGLAAALGDDAQLYGCVDTDGAWAIPPAFKRADSFRDGVARVKGAEGGAWYFVNTSGEPVVQH